MDNIESQNLYYSYEDDEKNINLNESKYFYCKIIIVSFIITSILILLFILM